MMVLISPLHEVFMLNSPIPSIIIVLLLIVFVTSLVELRRKMAFYRRAPSLRAVDLSQIGAEIASPGDAMVGVLKGLGFRRVGEGGYPTDQTPRIWYLVDSPGTTVAGVFVIGGRAYSGIYSWYGDEACVVHSLRPGGEFFKQPDYLYRQIDTPIETLYQQHLAALPEYTMRYGSPVRLDNMPEILRHDTIYNERFAQRKYRPELIRAAVRAGAAALLAVILIILVLVRS
jgi:hypothetical protein